MHNLEHQLRNASQLPQAELPSTDMWTRIEQQLRKRKRRRGWLLLAIGFLTASAIGWGIGLGLSQRQKKEEAAPTPPVVQFSRERPQPAVPLIQPEKQLEASEKTAPTDIVGVASQGTPGSIKALNSEEEKRKSTVAASELNQLPVSTIPSASRFVEQKSVESLRGAQIPTTNRIGGLLLSTLETRLPTPSGWSLGESKGAVMQPTSLPPLPELRTHWQADATYLPFGENFRSIIFLYSDQRDSVAQFPQSVLIDGQPDTLFQRGFVAGDRQIASKIYRLRVGRQFRSGWRVGLGVAYFRERFSSKGFAQQTAVASNLYTLGFEEIQEAITLNLSVGYIFLKQQRLNPYIELTYAAELWDRRQNESVVYEASSGTPQVQTDVTIESDPNVLSLRIPPIEIGAQYRITPTWSVGALIGLPLDLPDYRPQIGLQVRHHFQP